MSNLLHGFSRTTRQAEALRQKLEEAEVWMQVRPGRVASQRWGDWTDSATAGAAPAAPAAVVIPADRCNFQGVPYSGPAAALPQERHIPARLQTKVRRYLTQVWAPHAGINDAEQFEALPVELR